MRINFVKMQGTGNDFVMVDDRKMIINNRSKLATRLCNRHFGIGADGLIFILPTEKEDNDFRMRIFNSDGSEAEMCGNGIRCFAHYLMIEEICSRRKLKIETGAGIIKPEITDFDYRQSQVRVNMGSPSFRAAEIPINVEPGIQSVFDFKLIIEEQTFNINCVSMGNPHTIIFLDNIEDIDLASRGKTIENHPVFPEKTNVEFVHVINEREIELKVWERGSGITLACGTGACAAVVAGIRQGYLLKSENITVHLPGGDLIINWAEDDVFMTGPSTVVFEGTIDINQEAI